MIVVVKKVAEGYHEGGVLGKPLPFGPSREEGIGFRRAFAIGIRGTP